MSITHSTETRNAIADQVDSEVNTGTATAGDFQIIGTGTTVLVEITLSDPAFDAASGGSITLQGVPLTTTATAGGAASTFKIRDKDDSTIFSGSIDSTGSPDLTIDNKNINQSQSVKIDSLVYNAPS